MAIPNWRVVVGKALRALPLAWLLLAAGGVPPLAFDGARAAPACTRTWAGGSGSWHTAANWSPAGVPGAADHVCIPDLSPDYTVTYSTGSTSILSLQVGESLAITGGTLSLTSTAAAEESTVDGTLDLSGGTLDGPASVAVTGTLNWTQGTQAGLGETRIDTGGTLVIDAGFTPDPPDGSDPTARLAGSRVLRNDGGTIEHTGELVIADNASVRNDAGTYEGKTSSLDLSRVSCETTACADFLLFNAADATVESSGFFMIAVKFENDGTLRATDTGAFLTLIETSFTGGSDVGAGAGVVYFQDVSIDGPTTIDSGAAADMNPGAAIDGTDTLSVEGSLLFDAGTLRGSAETRIESGGVLVIDQEAFDSGDPSDVAQPVLEGSHVIRNNGGSIEHTGILLVGGTATVRNDSGTYEGKTSSLELSRITCDPAGCADPVLFNAAGATVESTGDYFVNVGFENRGSVRATTSGGFLTLEADTSVTFQAGSNVGAGDGTVYLGGLVSVDGATTIDSGAFADMIGGSTIDGGGLLTVQGTLGVNGGDTQQGSGETRVATGGTVLIDAGFTPDPAEDPDPEAVPPARLAGSRVLRNAGGTIEHIGELVLADTATILNDSGTYDGQTSSVSLSRITCDTAGCAEPALFNAAGAIFQSSGYFLVTPAVENSGTVRATAVGGFLTLEVQGAAENTFTDGSHIGSGGGRVFLGATTQLTGTTTIDSGGTADANPDHVIDGSGDLVVAGTLIWDQGTQRGSGETEVASGGLLVIDREVMDEGLPVVFADPPVLAGSRILRNSGGTIEQRSDFVIGGTAIVRNDSGLYLADPSTGSALKLNCDAAGCVDPALVNSGTVESDTSGTFTVDVGFDNPGTVAVDSGTLELKRSFAQFAPATKTLTGGTYVLEGTFKFVGAEIETNAAGIVLDGLGSAIVNSAGANGLANLDTNAPSGHFEIDGDRDLTTAGPFSNGGDVVVGQDSTLASTGSYTQSAGSTLLEHASSVLTATGGSVVIQGGTLGGVGSVGPAVVNGGTVTPGLSPGILHVTGTYSQGPLGTLRIELGGTTVGTGFDRLDVTGSCSLNGALAVATVNGFTPGAGDDFRFLQCSSRTGTFSSVDGTTLTLTYDATGATLGSRAQVSVSDVAVTEGNSGTTNALFQVSLSSASSVTVTVDYATADGSATAPGDYAGDSDTLVFSPGQTTRAIAIEVVGDTIDEPDETFDLGLSNPTNATIADGLAVGTIVDDDVADRILFSSSRTGLGDIYVMNADGSAAVRLTTSAAPDLEPAWSPNRSMVAFTSARAGIGDIYVMNANGSGQTRLTTHASIDASPAWSPDGTKIAFSSGRTGNGDIYVMNANGSGQTRLTTDSSVDGFPVWSPDGTKIAFSSGRSGNGDIYVMNANGSGQTRLTTSSSVDGFAAWSPDGTKIAFASSRTGNGDIYVMLANGSAQTRLTTSSGVDAEPAWFRTGAKLAFSSLRDGNPEIYSMLANGGSQTRLTTHSSLDLAPDP